MAHSANTPQGSLRTKTWQMPDTLVLIFFIALFAAALTYIVPAGQFETISQTYSTVDGTEKTRTILDPSTFEYAVDANGEPVYTKVGLFESGGGVGFLNFMFEGLVSGDKWGSAIGVIMFMLIIGGAFGIVTRTGTVDNGLLRLIDKTQGNEKLFIPVIFFLFSIGGAVFGMGEESVAFAIIIAPMMLRLGYDGITTVMVTYVSTQIGFGASWMNPFSVAVAQSVAEVAPMSGAELRIAIWLMFTLIGIGFTMWYANGVQKDPTRSYSYASDQILREKVQSQTIVSRWSLGDTLVLLTLLATIVWVIWGVVMHGYYLPEIASQFFTMGLIAGVIGIIFKLNNMTVNDVADAFKEGAGIMMTPALLVGAAKGIMLLLGGVDASAPTVLNTILHSAGEFIGDTPEVVSAWLMLVFQSVFNFFVTSGSGQAALTMPLMAPLADIVGVSRQVSVLAFQLGDGFTNILVPTSANLMAVLGVCRIDWGDWARFCWRFLLMLMAISSVVVVAAQMFGYA